MFKKFINRFKKKSTGHEKYYLPIFMGVSVSLALLLVVVSMTIYDKSGAAQLDLSRPGYVSVRAQSITNDNDFQSFSSTGSIDKKSINEFKKLYDKQAEKVKTFDAFGGDPLSTDSLGISVPVTDETANQ